MEKTRKLGQTDMEITAIGYGCMGQTHAYGVVEAEEDMVALMRYAHEVGYTFFDTAPIYGEANEQYLGKAVAPFRKAAVVATKFGIVDDSFFAGNEDALNSSRDSIRQQVDASLKRLGTDYIDLYYQHRIDPKTAPEEVAETMAELIKAGKIRAWGVSFAPKNISGGLMRYVKYPLSKICILLWQGRMREPISRFAKNWGSPMCRPALLQKGISVTATLPGQHTGKATGGQG